MIAFIQNIDTNFEMKKILRRIVILNRKVTFVTFNDLLVHTSS